MMAMRELSCRQVRRIIGAFRREDWPEHLRGAIEEHLRGCSGCRREVTEAELLSAAMASDPPEATPPDFAARVLHRVSERATSGQGEGRTRSVPVPLGRGWQPALAVALVLVIVLGVAVALYRPNPAAPDTGPASQPVQVASQNGFQGGEDAFLEDLVRFHSRYADSGHGMDAGVLLVSGSSL